MKQETVVSKPNPVEANQQLKDEAANQNLKNSTLKMIESSANKCGRADSVWGPMHAPLWAIYLQCTVVRAKSQLRLFLHVQIACFIIAFTAT